MAVNVLGLILVTQFKGFKKYKFQNFVKQMDSNVLALNLCVNKLFYSLKSVCDKENFIQHWEWSENHKVIQLKTITHCKNFNVTTLILRYKDSRYITLCNMMRKVKDVLNFYLLRCPFRVTVASFSHILLPFKEVALQMHKMKTKRKKAEI